MIHFGAMSPETGGHLHPMMSLGRELQRRGHCVTFYQSPQLQSKLEAAGFEWRSCPQTAESAIDSESLAGQLSRSRGLAGLRHTIDLARRSISSAAAAVPAMLRSDGIDVFLVDEAVPAGPTIAEAANLPFVQLSIALLLDGEPTIPPFCTAWRYRTDLWGVIRNVMAYKVLGRLMRPSARRFTSSANDLVWARSPLPRWCGSVSSRRSSITRAGICRQTFNTLVH